MSCSNVRNLSCLADDWRTLGKNAPHRLSIILYTGYSRPRIQAEGVEFMSRDVIGEVVADVTSWIETAFTVWTYIFALSTMSPRPRPQAFLGIGK